MPAAVNIGPERTSAGCYTKAADLMLPGADCFVFDHRVVRWNFQRGDGTNPVTTPSAPTHRTIRAISSRSSSPGTGQPHADYKPD